MTSAARNHDIDPPESADIPAVGNAEGTEYATRGVRGLRAARPHLRMVSPLRPERASRGVFAVVVTGLLGIGMVLILVINTSLAQGAFTVSELKAEQSVLTQQEQTLSELVAAAAAPENLEQQARELGMVPTETPVFLDVASGQVLGKPKPAAGARSSVPRLLTPADATVTEAVDNGAADLPVAPPADIDPAAVDAAAAQAAAANAAAEVAATAAGETAGPVAGEMEQAAVPVSPSGTTGKKGKKADGAASENELWQDSTVLDVTVSSGDAGLVAVPVQ